MGSALAPEDFKNIISVMEKSGNPHLDFQPVGTVRSRVHFVSKEKHVRAKIGDRVTVSGTNSIDRSIEQIWADGKDGRSGVF